MLMAQRLNVGADSRNPCYPHREEHILSLHIIGIVHIQTHYALSIATLLHVMSE